MHPEIVREEPGNCPICGMALEPVMPGLDDGDNPELAEYLARKSVGDPCTLTITGKIQEIHGAKLAIIAVEEVATNDYDEDTGVEDEDSPAMALFAEPEPAKPI